MRFCPWAEFPSSNSAASVNVLVPSRAAFVGRPRFRLDLGVRAGALPFGVPRARRHFPMLMISKGSICAFTLLALAALCGCDRDKGTPQGKMPHAKFADLQP